MSAKRLKFTVCLSSFICALSLTVLTVSADLIVDVDVGTIGPQSSLFISSGDSVTVSVWFDPMTSGPLSFNGVGIDLGWSPTGSAIVTPTTPPIAGTLASFAPTDDIVSGTPVVMGAPLASVGLPHPFEVFSVGGVGLSDPGTTDFGFFGPIGVPVDIFDVTFTITGLAGDMVFFSPSGILGLGTGSAPGVGPFVMAGDTQQLGPGVSPSFTDFLGPGVITIVPEPSMIGYALVSGGLLYFRRRKICRLA